MYFCVITKVAYTCSTRSRSYRAMSLEQVLVHLACSLPLYFNEDSERAFCYCSTCKRFLENKCFNFSYKTCKNCLFRSRARAKSKRSSLSSVLELRSCVALSNLKSRSFICSSCKVMKAFQHFKGKRKTCTNCLRKRYTKRTFSLTNRCLLENLSDST